MDASAAWKAFESGDYELAQTHWQKMLKDAVSQEETDSANWGLAYVLLRRGQFSRAKQIWEEIFNRTLNHKALHQMAMVERESGHTAEALAIYGKESAMIPDSDTLAKAVNLYELSYCSLLLNDLDSAQHYLEAYRRYTGKSNDLIEEACFYRLEGDIFAKLDKSKAQNAYESSVNKFRQARDEAGALEVLERLEALSVLRPL